MVRRAVLMVFISSAWLSTAALAQLHPGGEPMDPSIPNAWAVNCPGATNFDELAGLDDEALGVRAAELAEGALTNPADLQSTVNASAAIMEQYRRMQGRTAVLTIQACRGAVSLLEVSINEGAPAELLRQSDALFLQFARDNYRNDPGGSEGVAPGLVLCAVVTPLGQAMNISNLESLPDNLRLAAAIVPPEWLRLTVEDLGRELAGLEWPDPMRRFMQTASELGITSAVTRNFQFYAEYCAGDLAEAVSILEETLALVPDDEIVARNLEVARRELLRVNAAEAMAQTCEAGDLGACVDLGVMYEDGDGVNPDAQRALELYEQACEAEYLPGCTNAGAMLLNGVGSVPENRERAATLFRQACEQGNASACLNLGTCYEYGAGVGVDMEQAASFYQRACELGDRRACER